MTNETIEQTAITIHQHVDPLQAQIDTANALIDKQANHIADEKEKRDGAEKERDHWKAVAGYEKAFNIPETLAKLEAMTKARDHAIDLRDSESKTVLKIIDERDNWRIEALVFETQCEVFLEQIESVTKERDTALAALAFAQAGEQRMRGEVNELRTVLRQHKVNNL